MTFRKRIVQVPEEPPTIVQPVVERHTVIREPAWWWSGSAWAIFGSVFLLALLAWWALSQPGNQNAGAPNYEPARAQIIERNTTTTVPVPVPTNPPPQTVIVPQPTTPPASSGTVIIQKDTPDKGDSEPVRASDDATDRSYTNGHSDSPNGQ